LPPFLTEPLDEGGKVADIFGQRTRGAVPWEAAPGILGGVQALVAAASIRLDVVGIPAVDGLDLTTRGERSLVLGAPRALFEAAAGLRKVAHGELRVEGAEPSEAVRSRRAAGVPLDPPLPKRWSVAEYVTWSARLAGHDRTAGLALAREAIEATELGALASARLAVVPLAARRATVLAAALATGAGALLIDNPLSGLGDDAAPALQAFERVVGRVLEKRRWAIFAASMPLQSPIASCADEAIVVEGARVLAQGAPSAVVAQTTTLAVRIGGSAEAVALFAREVESSGGKVSFGALATGSVHARVDLGPLVARDLFRLALTSGATLLELRPFALPLS
jgi:ABC-type multidrug transport system ATPase subunit